MGTKKGSTAAADLELDDDDGDEEWDDDDPLGSGDPADEFAFLSCKCGRVQARWMWMLLTPSLAGPRSEE